MLKFDEQKQLDSVNGALRLRGTVEGIVDEIYDGGYDNIYYLGIGGTYASGMQAVEHMAGRSALPVFVENAAEFLARDNRRITDRSVAVISSVTGTTEEMVKAVKVLQERGTRIFGFIDVEDSPLAKACTWCVSYPMNEQIKFFMVGDRLMQRAGEFEDYEAYYKELEQHLAQALVDAEKQADEFGQRFAEEHKDDAMHYFVGAGNQWGATYSYAMCYWEEQHWIRTKSIHAAEFFHGMLEIVDRDTNVTVLVGEDGQRALSERVAKFLPRICGRYTIIDTKDYALKGISEKYRGDISHLVMRVVCNRIDRHIERLNCHPMEIRRYYRQLEY